MTTCENCGRSLHESELVEINHKNTNKMMEVCDDCAEFIYEMRNSYGD